MKTFAIVGFGYSGMAVFCRLVNELINTPNAEYKITIFEKDLTQFATGVPYTADSPSIWTLNNPAAKFKLVNDDVSLADWMSENRKIWQGLYSDMNEEYPPRALVGLYLKYQFVRYKKKAAEHGIQVEEVIEEITDIVEIEDTWNLITLHGKPYSMNTVFLCFGHAPNNQFLHLTDSPNYFSATSPLTDLQKIPKEANVHIIGGQASFVDIVIWFTYVNQHLGKIYSVTRNPAIMSTKGNRDECGIASINRLANQLKAEYRQDTLTLAEGQTLFRNAYLQVAKNPVDLKYLPRPRDALSYQLNKYTNKPNSNQKIGNVDELRSFVINFYFSECYKVFWEKLKEKDKQAFSLQFYSFICAYLTGIAPLNAQLLLELYDRKIVIERCGLKSIQYDDKNKTFKLNFVNGLVDQAAYLIDTSGCGYMLDKLNTDYPLLCNLVKKGYLVPGRFGGIELTEASQAISRRKELQPNLICIGPVASYCHPVPTPFSTFIAIDAIEKAVQELFAVNHAKVSKSSLTL